MKPLFPQLESPPTSAEVIPPHPLPHSNGLKSPSSGVHPAKSEIYDGSNLSTNGGPRKLTNGEKAVPENEEGMTAKAKDLYREDQRAPWEEWAPEGIGINAKNNPESNKFALIVRRERQIGDTDEPVLALHSITIHSPLLKSQLGLVFAEYPGVNTNLKHLTFNRPFDEFFHRWTEFVKAKPNPSKESESAHYKLLFDIIAGEIKPHIDRAEDLINNKVISFRYLWTLFPPGIEIYSRVDGQDRLYLLTSSGYGQSGCAKFFSLTCTYVETDGDRFGFTTTELTIGCFENVKLISDLSAFPFHLHANGDEIRKTLNARGRKFERLRGFHHVSYEGFYTFQKAPFAGSRKRYVQDTRVIIDCSSFVRYNADCHVRLDPLSGPPQSRHLDVLPSNPRTVNDLAYYQYTLSTLQTMQQTARHTRGRFTADTRQNVNTSKSISEDKSLSEDNYVYCTPVVKGFCLRAKEWVHVYVDSVRDIEWSSGTFESLVLPHDYKRIVWAFVKAQISHSDDFDDIIKGKGKGFIMLLSGEPGTGKTLTAESVSESMKRPLYSLSAGELGNKAGEVEGNLQKVLELSTKWGAVLLIDECDVFMVKRSTSDLKRNQLVSVFLRLLEYYQGVMLLTTNRIDSFDPAFESRIHLTIDYPKLNLASKLHVWKTFIGATKSTDITDRDLQWIAKEELNGRQIKNAVKTARLLAAEDKQALGLEHIETVLRVKRGDRAYLGDRQQKG